MATGGLGLLDTRKHFCIGCGSHWCKSFDLLVTNMASRISVSECCMFVSREIQSAASDTVSS